MDLYRLPNRLVRHAVAVAVEADQAGLGDAHIGLVEAVERPRIADQRPALGLEHLPDRPVFELGVGGRLGIGDTALGEPAVQLRQGLEPKPRGEELLAGIADLVLRADAPLGLIISNTSVLETL